MPKDALSFGPFELREGTLSRDGKPVPVGVRGMALLSALAEADGVLGKEALLEAGWPGTIVEEGNLTVQIATLRKALGPREDGSEWIMTVPRLGYRLIRGEGVAANRSTPSMPRIPSVAVLPFQNMSSDPEQDYFADGVVENIIIALSRFKSIMVVARNSSFVFKGRAVDVRQAAQLLGARYVVEGSVRRAGDQLRIAAQLIDGETGAHLWANSYDGPVEDVFAVQDRITESVVALVEPRIQLAEMERTRLKPPDNLDSYDLYLQALALALSTQPGANARTIELIEKSLALDPDFPPALAIAAHAEIARFDRQQPGASDAARLRGLAYARRALASLGTDPQSRVVAALATIILGQEYDSGMGVLRQAVVDNPNSVVVMGYAATGALRSSLLEEAERHFMRAIELYPGDRAVHWYFSGMAHVRLAQERFDEAIAWTDRGYGISADNPMIHWYRIAALAKLDRLPEAAEWLARLNTVHPGYTLARVRAGMAMRNPLHLEVVIEGLRLAGMPEG